MEEKSFNSRRQFLINSGVATLGFMGLNQFLNPLAEAHEINGCLGYGPLQNDDKGILNLPKGFEYKIISKKGKIMDDGWWTPGRPDGMGAFEGDDGKVILVRNHENSPDDFENGAFGPENENLAQAELDKFYEKGKGNLPALGGTTTLVYNEKTGEVEQEFMSLAGTVRNCAGGVTPWNSWLTCEESVVKAGDYSGNLEKDHGFVFEVLAKRDGKLQNAIPIKEMGRFNHEAVAVDPRTGIVFLTRTGVMACFTAIFPMFQGNYTKEGNFKPFAFPGEKEGIPGIGKGNKRVFSSWKTSKHLLD
ncbi:DUF839 domain-containing protein [Echinicola jeungdonensis]|uniref:alkaline phosphatase PhoX n=1 Tax=Echinicola jeungdonensis TaxID=709343 RepID=UPI0025B34B6A|nr:alkaline phosphatase PhoX [Echinicola jeungdonensis]MDN3670326.1 DUF839 domain-containing protein [Echinicola jeungdonensis]